SREQMELLTEKMNLPFFIARRYFFSRKISNVIHIIAGISLAGIMVGAFALITILSAFNGFEEVVGKLYNTFDSDLRITPVQGKYFLPDSVKLLKIRKLEGVTALTEVIEENALVKYREKQTIATFKAIEPKYLASTGIDSMIFVGEPVLTDKNIHYTLVGAGVGAKLNLQAYDDTNPLQVYVPKKGEQTVLNADKAFNRKGIFCSGVFSIQQDFDSRYILLPIDFARDLVQEPQKITSIEVNIKNDDDIEDISESVSQLLGKGFKVADRYQQQPLLYKVMRSEKLAVYLVLSFILLIAAFNLIGALLMLAIEKQKDMAILVSMGATPKTIQNIIMLEGLILSFSGAVAGILLATLVCWLQMKYGFVKISEGSTFVIQSYPIAFDIWDFVLVFITVIVLGFIASYYPAHLANRKTDVEILRGRK
ncbi:MAG: ABC transporter permease, partial [Sphingobacteriales bacterium]